jgi:hypothetical protein
MIVQGFLCVLNCLVGTGEKGPLGKWSHSSN